MGELLGFIVVFGVIGLLIFELVRQMKAFSFTDKGRFNWKNTMMIVSLFGILLFFSLNLLVGMKVIVNDYITSNGTSIGVYASFIVHMIAKFGFRNKKRQAKMPNTLLK